MKVSKVSNDKNSVTLTISGSPSFDAEKVNTGNYGTVELAGRYFGLKTPVAKRIPVVYLGEEEQVEGGYFYPYFDAVIEKDHGYDLTVILNPHSAKFADDFSEEQIILENDFENAEIISLKKSDEDFDGAYELTVNVPKDDSRTDGSYSYIGTITLDVNSLIDKNGKGNAEPVSASRSYSAESLGRDLSEADVAQMKEIVGGFGNTTFGTVYGTLSGAASAGSTAYTVLGWFGVFPSVASRHGEIMDQLTQINEKLRQMNTQLEQMNNTLERHTDMLYEIEKELQENALSNFDILLARMNTEISEIEYALSKKNARKIVTLLEEYPDEVYDNEEELYFALDDIAWVIGRMPANNIYTINDKILILDECYKNICFLLNQSGSNPINRYVQLCSLTDNFTTTSLSEKQLYSLNIDLSLKKALGLLNFFIGYDANETNRGLYKNAYFPDVTAGVQKQGFPFCYLMNDYVHLRTPDLVLVDMKENMTENTSPYVMLSTEDIKRFADRMHGRTLWDELTLAGYTGLEVNTYLGGYTATDTSPNIVPGYGSDQACEGVAFKFVSSPKLNHVGDAIPGAYSCRDVEKLVMFGTKGYSNQRYREGCLHVGKYKGKTTDGEAIVYAAYGLMFNDKSFVNERVAQAVKHHTDYDKGKQTSEWRYEMCYPMMYFLRVE